jgi:hypothetical protein
VTKVSLQHGSEMLPIFDGGIAVYKDVFVVQYPQSAEYIKIHNKGHPNLETITRIELWNYEPVQPEIRKTNSKQENESDSPEDEESKFN